MSDHRQVSLGRKVAYGFGSVAFGVKSNGFDYFFLIFYSQVMGQCLPCKPYLDDRAHR